MERVLVTGAGGFIGGHLVERLKNLGYYVRGVDIKHSEYRESVADQFWIRDLRRYSECRDAVADMDWVFNLAADMGGIGYIGTVTASLTRNNTLISLNMLEAARNEGIKKFFFSSSACIYPAGLQKGLATIKNKLSEDEDIPADPEPGYGWEKLYTEQLCKYYMAEYGLKTYVARFHNVFGPYGTYKGGREKAPAALCRKAILAKQQDVIEVWGDGKQLRTFLYIDDCLDAVVKLVQSDFSGPINIGSERLVTLDELADMIIAISGKKLSKKHDSHFPVGVQGRCSDNTLIKKKLNWEPKIELEVGLRQTYNWILGEVERG